tara:strand:- start:1239 stop:2636 length:1398 start_codon:yes stop_codon:yes gene_type:complete
MKKILKKINIIHFIGIGGIGMSGIAELMFKLGYKVQGSDLKINENIRRLQKKKIKIFLGHKKSNITEASVIVVSSAIKKNNLEIKFALKKGLPIVSRAEMLGELMRFKRGIAVAGSHGKTTTTSILGNILQKANFDPTIVNGGIINSLSSNSRMGNGEWMIAEADESDGSFLHLPNEINIITNIDEEHMEYFKNFKNLLNSFKKFSSNIPFYGSSIICLENDNTKKIIKQITNREVITYGLNKSYGDLNITKIKYIKNKSYFDLVISSKLIQKKPQKISFILNLLGKHNVLNATAAIGVALKIGIDIKTIKNALMNFTGVQRRFTFLKKIKHTEIYDDYAHHPKEIEASLEIAKHLCNNKIILVFQPHRYSRTKVLLNDFVKILKKIDILVLTNIYPAGEKEIKNLNLTFLNKIKRNSNNTIIRINDKKELFPILNPYMNKKNLIIFMGAGSITNWAKDFINNYD